MKNLIFLGLFIFSASCTHTRAPSTSGWDLGLVIASNRHLNLEPCGCSFNQLGGLAREWEFLRQFKQEGHRRVIQLSNGSSFAKSDGTWKQWRRDGLPKAHAFISALNTLKVDAIAITTEDLQIGLSTLQDLKRRAEFAFISTNLVPDSGTSVPWQSRFEIQTAAFHLIALSVSNPSAGQSIPHVRWVDPVTALKTELAQIKRQPNSMVVVLSALSERESLELRRELPEINLLVSAEEKHSNVVNQFDSNFLFAMPGREGRKLMAASFQFSDSFRGFYSPEVASLYKNQTTTIPTEPTSQTATYSARVVDVNQSFDTTAPNLNPIPKIIEDYLAKQRRAALSVR